MNNESQQGKGKQCEHPEEIERLKITITTLRSELDKAHKEATEYATRAQDLFDEFAANPPQLTVLPTSAAESKERSKSKDQLVRGREELELERVAFTEAAVQLGRERAGLEVSAILFSNHSYSVDEDRFADSFALGYRLND